MAEAVVGATIELLLENLLSLAKEEIGLFWNFNDDLEKLKQSVVMIQNLLEDAEKKKINDEAVKCWLLKLEAVAFDADYLFDELDYHVLRKKVQRDNKMKKKVRCFPPYTNSVTFRRRMAKKIKEIKNKLNSINQEASELGIQTRITLAGVAGTDAPGYLETDSFSLDPVFVGRENEVTKMVGMLTSSLTEEVISVYPIFGMGGLGKTTLAREVYNNGDIVSHFGQRIWVHVPKNFDPMIVLKKTLESLTGEIVDGSREVVLRKLGERLKDKTYLLVLDNIWDEGIETWGNFITSLKGISHSKGNAIMVTTRQSNVASIVKTGLDVDELGGLSEEDCWSIVKAKAFGGEGVDSEFETIGIDIAKRCGGLPLAAHFVGALLRGKSKDEWVSIEKNQLSNIGGDEITISKILKLSFDNLLSSSLKKCFAFCSLFPKGWRIEKDEVIQLWMAEGLLRVDQGKNVEVVGNEVFNMLVHSSLLQAAGNNSIGNAICTLHDLVHDFALSILNPKFPKNTSQLRHVSISSNDEASRFPKEYARCLRALFLCGNVAHFPLTNMECLHVLILNDEDIKELPTEIGKVISLRYLDISNTRIECLPNSIGDLYHLQTLRAIKEDGIRGHLRSLPSTFKYLISLKHLYIPFMDLPPGFGKLVSLETLSFFLVGNEEGCRIMELAKLTNLKGKVTIGDLQNISDKEEARNADLFHKPNIYRLNLLWPNLQRTNNDENVLEGLQPHPYLKGLGIAGFRGKSFPLWTRRMAVRENLVDRWIRFDNLLEVNLFDCNECQEVPMLGHLPNLKVLNLKRLPNVKSLGYPFHGIEENGSYKKKVIVFPALETLLLIDMENLTTWEEICIPAGEVSMFPRLVSLTIFGCRELMSVPSSFPSIEKLVIVDVKSGLPLANICDSKLTTLTSLVIFGVEELVHLPNELFCNNRALSKVIIDNCINLTHLVPRFGGGGSSLRKLKISNCLNLEEIPEDLHRLNALEVLLINECPNLKSIAYPRGGGSCLTSLRKLTIGCSSLINLPIQMIESCVASLKLLWLSGSKSIANLPQVISILPKMPRLTILAIGGVPKFNEVGAEIACLRSLACLVIGGSSDCNEFVSFNGFLDRIFPALECLQVLALLGFEHWDALPDRLQDLVTLKGLMLSEFGIEALPEWLGNLSSLKSLGLSKCGKLRHLPSKKAMQGLNRLTNISIDECPLLKQNLEDKASHDSEWSKISHIPTIEVDESLPT